LNSSKLPVTVVVPVRNEAANLARCLRRLGRFAQVIVVDSASTDGTPQIALEHGAQLIDFAWNGKYPKKRNWLLLNHRLACGWVLFLDADELVDEPFCDALGAALQTGSHDGYWLNYTNHFLGKRLRHGLPQRKLALFRIGAGLYERIDEDAWSSLDMEIHEHPVLAGSIGEIAAPIAHDDDRGLAAFLKRHTEYALWEARRTVLLRTAGAGALAALTSRQRFKYRHIAKWWYPWFYFLFAYGVRAGFLDGAAGFHYAFYKFWYFQTIRLLIAAQASVPPQRVS
jgi:glycosyltransferase involved in cell wall biosynthesis